MDKIKKLSIMVLAIIVLSIGLSSTVAAYDPYDDYYDYSDEADLGFLGLSGIMCFIFLIPVIIGIILAIWVYKDAEKRGSSGILWLLIVLITGIIGLIIWLVVRPPIGGHPNQATGGASAGRTCPSCGRPIPMDASVCPYCGKDFRNP
jgi:Na+/H+-dicarboxylate symporter